MGIPNGQDSQRLCYLGDIANFLHTYGLTSVDIV